MGGERLAGAGLAAGSGARGQGHEPEGQRRHQRGGVEDVHHPAHARQDRRAVLEARVALEQAHGQVAQLPGGAEEQAEGESGEQPEQPPEDEASDGQQGDQGASDASETSEAQADEAQAGSTGSGSGGAEAVDPLEKLAQDLIEKERRDRETLQRIRARDRSRIEPVEKDW